MNSRNLANIALTGVLMLALLLGPAAADQNYYVDAVNGHDGVAHSGSQIDPWHTITHALSRTGGSGSSGNLLVIHLAAGSYDTDMGADHESFPLNLGSYISLVGVGRVITVIDAENADASVITIISRDYVSVESVTVKQGAPTGLGFGAGLRCESSHYVTIDDCLLTDNVGLKGAGIYLKSCGNTTVKSCLVTYNSVSEFNAFGAGIYMENCGSDVLIDDCVITGNTMGAETLSSGGGGVGCYNSSPVLRLCRIQNNMSWGRKGGGAYLEHNSYAVIDNCIITGNQAGQGSGLACSDCAGSASKFIQVINNTDIYGNLGEGKKGLGAYIEDSNIEFQDCKIRDHKDGGIGAGVYILRINLNFSVIFERTVITGNEATNHSGTGLGGGIWAQATSRVKITIEDCTIEDNEARVEGGGIYVNGPALTINSSTIRGNRSGEGSAGIMYFASSSDPIDQNKGKILNCLITENVCSGNNDAIGGAGIQCYRNASPIIFNCLIAGNTMGGSGNGGGMYLYVSASPQLVNCTIADNVGEGVMARVNDGCVPTLTNCILWNNDDDLVNVDCSQQVSYSDIEDGDCEGSKGNIQDDPLFVSGQHGDYYLSQYAAGQSGQSDCIDGGDDTVTHYGLHGYTTRSDDDYDSGTVDMGYHYESSIYCVSRESGDDSYDGRSYTYEGGSTGPWKTISHALSGTPAGTADDPIEIRVMPGDYDIDNGETFPLDVTSYKSLVGLYGRDETTIDAYQEGAVRSAITIDDQAYVTIEGFKITGGRNHPTGFGCGGGICCTNASHITIKTCDIDGNEAKLGAGIYFRAVTDSKITGTSITNNRAVWVAQPSGIGGGLHFRGAVSTVVVEFCQISDNVADKGGGGIALWEGPASDNHMRVNVNGSTVNGNTAEQGGGLYAYHFCNPVLLDSQVMDNTATYGGGFYCENECLGSIRSTLIQGNEASQVGGGIYCLSDCEAMILNCTIEGNTPSGITASSASEPVVTNCIIWNNLSDLEGDSLDCSKVTCCDVENGTCRDEDRNVFSADPLFVPRDPADPENKYTGYYLAELDVQAADSPCLNAGDNQASAYGLDVYTTCTDGRYDQGTVDIGYHYSGAYEGTDDTYIELASFEAKASGRNISISWETGTEINNAGFDLYRVEAGDRATPRRMNERMIPAKGSPAAGASYEFIDADVRPGVTYGYYLVDIDTSGTATTHSPVTARVPERPVVIPDERIGPRVSDERPATLRVISFMPRFWPVL